VLGLTFIMSAVSPPLLNWLARYAGFPARRLPAPAELMLLFAAAAEADEAQQRQRNGSHRLNDTAMHVSQKALSENRRKTHFKSDNRTAV